MSQSKKILKNIFSMSVAEFATKGIAFFTGAYMARVAFEGLGAVATVASIFLFMNSFVILGFNNVGAREIAKNPSRFREYVNSIITIRFILSIIVYSFLIYYVNYTELGQKYKILIYIYGLSLFASAFLMDWYYQGIERMQILAIRQLISGILNFTLTILIVKNASHILYYVTIITCTSLINSFWMLGLYLKEKGPIKFYYNRELWISLFKSSVPIAISLISVTVLNNLNNLLMAHLLPNSFEYQNNILSNAFKIATFTIMPAAIFQGAFYPLLSRSETIPERRNVVLKYHNLNGFMAAILTIGVFSFSSQIIYIAYGAKYMQDGPATLASFALANVFGFFNVTNMTPLLAWKKEKQVMGVIIIGGIIVNTIANLILIPRFGAWGSASSNIISEIAISLGLNYFLYKSSGKIFITPYFKFFIPAIISCLIGSYVFSLIGKFAIAAPAGILSSGFIYLLSVIALKFIDLKEIKGLVKR